MLLVNLEPNWEITMSDTSKPPVATSILVALKSLFLSSGNVRKTEPTQSGIEELAAMIDSQGLLNPLQVTAEVVDGQETGRYGVEAGGRRLRALQWLKAKGKIANNHLVECRLINESDAQEVSLAENISQEGMHAADEFAAYRDLCAKGHSLDLIAAKFGVTVVHVQRRLKMANVAPALLDLYRSNEITLDHIMAFATTDDQERQLQVWNSLPAYNRQPFSIKRQLTENEIAGSDARVRLVGLENYEAAGGTLRNDLFNENESTYLTDPALLDKLVNDRLAQEAQTLREEGWAWVDILPNFNYQFSQNYVLPQKRYLPLTPENQASRLALVAEQDKLTVELEAEQDAVDFDDEKFNSLEIRLNQIEQELEELTESLLDTSALDKSTTGAIVTMNRDGLLIHCGLTRAGDQRRVGSPSTGTSNLSDTGKTRAAVPEKLMLNLSSHRTAAIQATMLAKPNVTLAALASKMAISLFDEFRYPASPIKISLTQCRHTMEKNAPTLLDSRATTVLEKEKQEWKNRLPEKSDEWFQWFVEQHQDVSVQMIVFATAHSADAIQNTVEGSDNAAPLAKALNLDMREWWDATPTSYLELIPKSKLVEAVTETAGEKVAAEMSKMKKDEAVKFASSHITGKGWLPIGLRESQGVQN